MYMYNTVRILVHTRYYISINVYYIDEHLCFEHPVQQGCERVINRPSVQQLNYDSIMLLKNKEC